MATEKYTADIIEIISTQVFQALKNKWLDKDIKSLVYRDNFRSEFARAAHASNLYQAKERGRYNTIFSAVLPRVNKKIRAAQRHHCRKSISQPQLDLDVLCQKEYQAIMLAGAYEAMLQRQEHICPPD